MIRTNKLFKIIIPIVVLNFGVLCSMSGNSFQDRYSEESLSNIERLYVATDRDSYVAGETIWLSLYCINPGDSGRLSHISEMAYIELYNATSLVLTFKVWLTEGRGGGNIDLPPTLPTGNYVLKAYTKHMYNEVRPVPFQKVISVYNVLSNERVKGNVIVSSDAHTPRQTTPFGKNMSDNPSDSVVSFKFGSEGKRVSAGNNFSFSLTNNIQESVSANVSVYKKDAVSAKKSLNIVDTFSSIENDPVLTEKFVPEYEGEIIRGEVSCDNSTVLQDAVLSFSVAGERSHMFMARLDSLGKFIVYTPPFFGKREVVMQIPYLDNIPGISYNIDDPFIKDAPSFIPDLFLDSSVLHNLKERSIEMQVGRRFGIDSLYEYTAPVKDPLLKSNQVIYMLDNYVRFPVMQEVITEFIPQLRVRKVEGANFIQVRLANEFRALTFSQTGALVLLDGVPVFDHEYILNFDPLKIESISVFTDEYVVGPTRFTGIVLFKTYRGDFSGTAERKNSVVVDYDGALYPSSMKLVQMDFPENMPDLRSLLYWDSLCIIDSKLDIDIVFKTSLIKGEYIIAIEGITSGGVPFFNTSEFAVR